MKIINVFIIMLVAITLTACFSTTGPSDELVSREIKQQTEKLHLGYITVEAEVAKRNVIADDLVEFVINIELTRTEKETPVEFLAAVAAGSLSLKEMGDPRIRAALMEQGQTNDKAVKITYRKVGEDWKIDSMK
jgi:hypothetical protein